MLELLEVVLNAHIAQLRQCIDMDRASAHFKENQALASGNSAERHKEVTAYVNKLHNYLSLAQHELRKAESNGPGMVEAIMTLGFNTRGHKMCCDALRQMIAIIEAELDSAENRLLACCI